MAIAAILAAFGAGYFAGAFRNRSPEPVAEFRMPTVRGDILHKTLDLPGTAIRVGPEVGPYGDVVARLRFTPDQPAQQAGLLLFQDADNYVRLARHFTSRTLFEFGAESAGEYAKPAGTFEYDSSGQDGAPVWLSIRRRAAVVEAFQSPNATDWRKTGITIQLKDPLPRARAAIYANRGRSDSKEIAAEFNGLAHGLVFHDLTPTAVDESTFPGWRPRVKCADGSNMLAEKSALVFELRSQGGCTMDLTQPAPPGDWILRTKLDFVASGGSSAGLFVAGDKGLARVIRWDVGGGSITAEHLGRKQINRRDYEGRPPVVLYLESKGGRLNARYTRDGMNFEVLALDLALSELGSNLVAGIQAGQSTWSTGFSGATVRFAYILREIHLTEPFR